MTFYAPIDDQWYVILELIRLAPDHEGVLQDIAAGPLEGFLGRFDERVIDQVESQAKNDSRFGRVLSGVWQHGMSEPVWRRVRALQREVTQPLPEMIPFDQAET